MALSPGELVSAFRNHFQTDVQPKLYRAPGRVNLIGEHTDYNLGYVFPIALEMACYAAITPNGRGTLRIFSQDLNAQIEIPVDQIATAEPRGEWTDYIIGVANQLSQAGFRVDGADLYVVSQVPAGSGLSSSAALEVASTLAFLGDRPMEPLAVARLSQRAETQFVGMPCGIMDQYSSVFGEDGSAIQIDCRSLEHEYVKLPHNVEIVAVNSLVKHELGTSAYRERVAECKAAVDALRAHMPHVQSLRDVSAVEFEKIQNDIPSVPRRRARHVISDSQRVLDLGAAASAGNLALMGRLFLASHRSMQYDYEISCREIDFLVDTASSLPGVYGSRMTGGGFGGCTVNLVAPERVADFTKSLSIAYEQQYDIVPVFYPCTPARGAERLSV